MVRVCVVNGLHEEGEYFTGCEISTCMAWRTVPLTCTCLCNYQLASVPLTHTDVQNTHHYDKLCTKLLQIHYYNFLDDTVYTTPVLFYCNWSCDKCHVLNIFTNSL